MTIARYTIDSPSDVLDLSDPDLAHNAKAALHHGGMSPLARTVLTELLRRHEARERDEQIAALQAQLAAIRYHDGMEESFQHVLDAAPSDVLDRVKREAAADALRQFAHDLRSRYPEDIWPRLEHTDHQSVNGALAGRVTGSAITRDRVSADMMRRSAAQADESANELRSAP